MMKLIMFIIFLIPLCFLNFWLIVWFMFLFMLIIMKDLNFSFLFKHISYYYGLDGVSYLFIMLSCWICALMLLSSFNIYYLNNYFQMFSFMVIFLFLMMLMVFSSLNLFLFYIYFEVSLIPLMVMIIGWGYQPERLMAGMYMIFYTMIFSLPMMVGLFKLYSGGHSMMFFELINLDSQVFYFLVNMVFFVKIPLYGIHLWLPKAHVEAPVSGSMILAGITLKLGGYGLIRLMKIFVLSGLKFNLFFIVFSLLGGLIVSFICLFQTDVKSLIAYSSISHMSMVLSGILTLNLVGFMGSLVLMLAHGLCSSGLFCMVNIYYERINSRSIYLLKGLMNVFPSFSLLMFLLSVNNMAAPPSLNLMGEILLMKSLIGFNNMLMLILVFLSFFSAVYSIYLFSFTNHGVCSSSIYSFSGGVHREYLLLILHWIPLNFLIIGMEMFNVF